MPRETGTEKPSLPLCAPTQPAEPAILLQYADDTVRLAGFILPNRPTNIGPWVTSNESVDEIEDHDRGASHRLGTLLCPQGGHASRSSMTVCA
jgi:hypothetical protein